MRPELHEVLRRWRALADEQEAALASRIYLWGAKRQGAFEAI